MAQKIWDFSFVSMANAIFEWKKRFSFSAPFKWREQNAIESIISINLIRPLSVWVVRSVIFLLSLSHCEACKRSKNHVCNARTLWSDYISEQWYISCFSLRPQSAFDLPVYMYKYIWLQTIPFFDWNRKRRRRKKTHTTNYNTKIFTLELGSCVF